MVIWPQDASSHWRLKAADLASGAAGLLGMAKPRGEELYFNKELTPDGYGTRNEDEGKDRADSLKQKTGESMCALM